MANRTLTWHSSKVRKGGKIGPTYYISADYQPVAVRMYAVTGPVTADAEVNILVDGVSILSNRTQSQLSALTKPPLTSGPPKTTAMIPKGDNYESNAEDLIGDPIEEGSWVHCELVEDGGCENLSVHLDLAGLGEED